ncbi:MAG: 4-hydroxy-tetrahydrodipicolinate synthase [Bacteroidales bacterium]|nr:4-hydroxy-tetrahydrodipicolinate synthase [Bacteroidales bacterium]
MAEINFRGTGVALVTPFTDSGEIDFDSLEKLVNHVINGGVEYLVALGTTAETPVLSSKEKEDVVRAIIKINAHRVPIIIGMGGNDTNALVRDISNYDFSSIDGILSVAPYYNKPTQEGIYEHFKAVSQASPLPVVLYNVPGRTSSNISTETCLKLANEFENIVAIKEASGDFAQIMEIIRNKPKNFHVVSGDDAITFPMISLGGSGVISVVGNAFPKAFSEMVRLALSNKIEESRKIHYTMIPVIDAMFAEGNPAGVKAFLSRADICTDKVRLPLIKASESLFNRVDKLLENF